MLMDDGWFKVVVVYIFVLGMAIMALAMYYMPEIRTLYSSGESNCSTLNDTVSIAYCLNQELNSFYEYNITNANKKMDDETFRIEGGVCSHAAEWYKSRLSAMGLKSKLVNVDVNSSSGHVYAMLEAEDAYCILDQTDVYCFRYG